MKIGFRYIIFSISLLALSSCFNKNRKKFQYTESVDSVGVMALDTSPYFEGETIVDDEYAYPYRPARELLMDIVHTSLKISFDTVRKHVLGEATITMKPYFYETDSVVLDARGFDISEVSVAGKNGKKKLEYEYSSPFLKVRLDRKYRATDSLRLYIAYTAKPDELTDIEGSDAISSDKGLYFINADGSDSTKPFQIWTQGETEANSCWFPTIDAPNEKMTQELFITVPDRYVTLSNGKLMSSKKAADGTRTDHWKQSKPHSVYLTMLAVGDFAIVKDKWRNLEVNYYVEPKYARYAKLVFGNTPEMLEFYSQKMGVVYPWEKFSQIVVRDFVSGAMENTSAVVHFDKLQHNAREHLDETYEDIIAHELFHHWFGDLVTAESWANLPLNESFATYGEYLWREYKYGKADAEYHRMQHLRQYLDEATLKPKKLIRYHYNKPDDMFDRHSYQKGSLVLHMLRNHVGDEAFFKSLNLFLTRNSYKSAELANLRLAFEEVCGQDLNWFFNQWFFQSEIPSFTIEYLYNEADTAYTVSYYQGGNVVYDVPLQVEIAYPGGRRQMEKVRVNELQKTFTFKVTEQPLLVDGDYQDILPCKLSENKFFTEWLNQYKMSQSYPDRSAALFQIFEKVEGNEETVANALIGALSDPFWKIREEAVSSIMNVQNLDDDKRDLIREKLKYLALYDPKAQVRISAFDALNFFKHASLRDAALQGVNDSSYTAASYALSLLSEIDSIAALEQAQHFINSESKLLSVTALSVMVQYGTEDYREFFHRSFRNAPQDLKYTLLVNLGLYLERPDIATDIKLDLVKYVVDAKTEGLDYISFVLAESAGQAMRETTTKLLEDYRKGKGNTTEIEKLEKLMGILDQYFPKSEAEH